MGLLLLCRHDRLQRCRPKFQGYPVYELVDALEVFKLEAVRDVKRLLQLLEVFSVQSLLVLS